VFQSQVTGTSWDWYAVARSDLSEWKDIPASASSQIDWHGGLTIGLSAKLMHFDHAQDRFLWLFYHALVTNTLQLIDSIDINILLEGLKAATIART
jgi:hypothetical protein